MENYQEEEGMRVPEVLRKYIPGNPEFIPYTKDLPKDSTSEKAKAKTAEKTTKPAAGAAGSVAAKAKEAVDDVTKKIGDLTS